MIAPRPLAPYYPVTAALRHGRTPPLLWMLRLLLRSIATCHPTATVMLTVLAEAIVQELQPDQEQGHERRQRQSLALHHDVRTMRPLAADVVRHQPTTRRAMLCLAAWLPILPPQDLLGLWWPSRGRRSLVFFWYIYCTPPAGGAQDDAPPSQLPVPGQGDNTTQGHLTAHQRSPSPRCRRPSPGFAWTRPFAGATTIWRTGC